LKSLEEAWCWKWSESSAPEPEERKALRAIPAGILEEPVAIDAALLVPKAPSLSKSSSSSSARALLSRSEPREISKVEESSSWLEMCPRPTPGVVERVCDGLAPNEAVGGGDCVLRGAVGVSDSQSVSKSSNDASVAVVCLNLSDGAERAAEDSLAVSDSVLLGVERREDGSSSSKLEKCCDIADVLSVKDMGEDPRECLQRFGEDERGGFCQGIMCRCGQ
jgi:hypothetical protein